MLFYSLSEFKSCNFFIWQGTLCLNFCILGGAPGFWPQKKLLKAFFCLFSVFLVVTPCQFPDFKLNKFVFQLIFSLWNTLVETQLFAISFQRLIRLSWVETQRDSTVCVGRPNRSPHASLGMPGSFRRAGSAEGQTLFVRKHCCVSWWDNSGGRALFSCYWGLMKRISKDFPQKRVGQRLSY